MQPMYPNPSFQTTPLLPTATPSPTAGGSNKSYIDGMSKEPGPSSDPPPYNHQKSGDPSQVSSTSDPRKSTDASEKGDIPRLQVSGQLLTSSLSTSQCGDVDDVNVNGPFFVQKRFQAQVCHESIEQKSRANPVAMPLLDFCR
jgi:hypothetical protein